MTSGIHKIYKLESVKFTAVPNWVVRDPSYTPNTFRLLAYLLSHEDGYEITYAQTERQTGMGRYAINEASKFLVSAGWLEVTRPKGADGRFAAKSWTLKNPTSVDDSTMEPLHAEPFHYGTADALKEDNSLEKTNTKRRQQQQAGKLPDDWQPTTELIAMFETKWPDVDQELHTENFKLHWWSTGRTMKRWNLAFQKWMNTEQDRAKKSNNRYNSKNDWNELDRWAKEQDGKDAN